MIDLPLCINVTCIITSQMISEFISGVILICNIILAHNYIRFFYSFVLTNLDFILFVMGNLLNLPPVNLGISAYGKL